MENISKCCFITEEFFLEHPNYIKILDIGNTGKQARRTHVCLRLSIEENTFYIPLRKNLNGGLRVFGRIGHDVPSSIYPNAGLDYRHVLIINESKYIEPHETEKLPASQYNIINTDYEDIRREFEVYLRKYINAVKKNRVSREPLFADTSLVNFHQELGL